LDELSPAKGVKPKPTLTLLVDAPAFSSTGKLKFVMFLTILQPLQSAAVLVMLIVFVPVLPKTPSEPPVSLKTDPFETENRLPARMLSVLLLSRLTRLPRTLMKLPPATFTSDHELMLGVVASGSGSAVVVAMPARSNIAPAIRCEAPAGVPVNEIREAVLPLVVTTPFSAGVEEPTDSRGPPMLRRPLVALNNGPARLIVATVVAEVPPTPATCTRGPKIDGVPVATVVSASERKGEAV